MDKQIEVSRTDAPLVSELRRGQFSGLNPTPDSLAGDPAESGHVVDSQELFRNGFSRFAHCASSLCRPSAPRTEPSLWLPAWPRDERAQTGRASVALPFSRSGGCYGRPSWGVPSSLNNASARSLIHVIGATKWQVQKIGIILMAAFRARLLRTSCLHRRALLPLGSGLAGLRFG
jgi:hypothetical protein